MRALMSSNNLRVHLGRRWLSFAFLLDITHGAMTARVPFAWSTHAVYCSVKSGDILGFLFSATSDTVASVASALPPVSLWRRGYGHVRAL